MRKAAILLGDEAIALGAIHAGISGVYGYPGTPSTEIFEAIESFDRDKKIHARWSTNEKVAYEQALGMSFAGKRALVTMKHVGLNVAADPFMNSAVTGVQGGLVLAVADDPGMHSSQNEQDSRFYAQFAMIPCLEPGDQQQAYDMMLGAFDLSEKHNVPVMLRLVTRLAHSRANIRVLERGREMHSVPLAEDWKKWTLLPVNARRNFDKLIAAQKSLLKESEESSDNRLRFANNFRRGILMSGIAANYVYENLGSDLAGYSTLHVCQYPAPTALVRKLVDSIDELLIVEEGYPLLEQQLTGLLGLKDVKVRGKLNGALPRTGELNPDLVRTALDLPPREKLPLPPNLAGRPPQLCSGCPHDATFHALKEALETFGRGRVFSDIGCYTLAALPPHDIVESCVDMGASISMATGASHAGLRPAVAAIGDSTFAHSGMTPLRDAARENTPVTVVILDNATVAMTGTQESAATGEELLNILYGLGAPKEHVLAIDPLPKNHKTNVEIFRRELAHEGLSVIVAHRECLEAIKKSRKGKA
ncbi:MAG: thiamine pyrophosphate-dependent enzyme [Pseudomonadota bacterium]